MTVVHDFTGLVEVLDPEVARPPNESTKQSPELEFAMKQTLGPVDPNFFRTFRLRPGSGRIDSPYEEHPWAYAALNRIATDASSVPFVIITEAPEGQLEDDTQGQQSTTRNGTGETPIARKRRIAKQKKRWWQRRRKWFTKLRRSAPGIPEWLHEEHRDSSPRKYMSAIRKQAPAAPLYLVCRTAGVVVVEEGPWVDLFEEPNMLMTRSQLWESTCVYLGEGGECFWVLETESDQPRVDGVIPDQIFPKGGEEFDPKINKETKAFEGWKLRTRNLRGEKEERVLSLDEVVQFKYFNPNNPVRGLSPLRPAALDIKQDHSASLFNNSFFEHGAQLGGVLTSDKQLLPRQQKEIREQFEARHGGVTQAFKTAVLEGGVKFTETGVRQRDMQFIQLRTMSRDIILAVTGVPKSEVGIIEDVNRATATISKRTMWQDTIMPKLIYIEDLLWSHLFKTTTGGEFWGMFDTSQVEALRDDLVSKSEIFATMAEKGYPINVLNDWLQMGLPAMEWGNVWWAAGTLAPISSDPTLEELDDDDDDDDDDGGDEPPEEEPSEDEPDEPEEDQDPAKPPIGFTTAELERADDGEDETEILSDLDGLLADGLITQEEYDLADSRASDKYDDLPDDFEVGSAQWDIIEREQLVPGERSVRQVVSANIFQIRKRQMKLFNALTLEPDEIVTDSIFSSLFPLQEFRQRISDKTDPVYEQIYDRSIDLTEDELDTGDFPEPEDLGKQDNPDELPLEGMSKLKALALERQRRRIMQTVNTIRRNIQQAMVAAIAEGLSHKQTGGLLRGAFGALRSKPRIIGATETASLVNSGRDSVFTRRRVQAVEWISARDEIVRREHVIFDAAGGRPRGHNWAEELGLGGAVTITRPHDPRAPARLVISCRCVLIPSTSQLTDQAIINQPPSAYERFDTDEYGSEATFRNPKTGKFSNKRQELHDAIIRKHFKGKTRVKEPIVEMLGGGPGSGKSSVSKLNPPLANSVEVNVDEIRKQLPEYATKGNNNFSDAKWNHNEASLIAQRVVTEAAAVKGSGGYNLLIDGTGDSSLANLTGKLEGYRAGGATRIIGTYVTLDTETAVARMIARGNNPKSSSFGRFVPEELMRNTHAKVSEVLPDAIKNGLFDEIQVFDNNVPKGSPPILIAKAIGSNLEIVDEEGWARFLAKANE